MCQTVGDMKIWCSDHTRSAYVWALHQFQLHPFHKSRFASLFMAAKEYACTVEGQQRISQDINGLRDKGETKLADALVHTIKFGYVHLQHQQRFLDERLSSLHREVTRLWARVAQSSEDLFTHYVQTCARELKTTPGKLLARVEASADPRIEITPDHAAAVRFISWDKTPPLGTPLRAHELTVIHHLESMTAQARNQQRLIAELTDPEGGVWQEYELPTGKRISYNAMRRELLLPDIETDGLPRVFKDVSESIAFALTSARRPGLFVAAAFFPAMHSSLDNKESSDFSFAVHLSNNVFPLSSSITGPVPERILPDPVRRAIAQGLH